MRMTSTCVTHTFQQQMWIANVRGSPSKNATSCASAKHLSESLYLVLQAALNFETAEEKYAAGHGSVTPLCRLQTRRGASIENIEACGMALHAKCPICASAGVAYLLRHLSNPMRTRARLSTSAMLSHALISRKS